MSAYRRNRQGGPAVAIFGPWAPSGGVHKARGAPWWALWRPTGRQRRQHSSSCSSSAGLAAAGAGAAAMSTVSVGVTKVKKQRKRASLVCSLCKEKKIKCDRQKPCSNCIRASSVHSCNYNYEVKRSEKNSIRIVEKELGGEDGYVVVSGATCSRKAPVTAPVMMEPSIMDTPFRLPEAHLITRKPSRTLRTMNISSVYTKPEPFLSYSFLLSFKDTLRNERELWKSRNFKTSFQLKDIQLGKSDTDRSNDELNALVERLVCNNYYAILERLGHFQTHLNKVLFGSYIPMGVVQLIFHHYFSMKREGIAFRRPRKNFEYSFIALITSLVELTNIFTRNDPSIFNFTLPHHRNEFNELSVTLLNTSNYRRKCSIFAVYTILNLRLSLMIYGNAQSAGVVSQNSYPLFQTAVNMCVEMGISMNLDKVVYLDHPDRKDLDHDLIFAKEIPAESLKVLWNYLLITDASYFVCMSAPPYIDDRYTHGFYLMPVPVSEDFSSYVTLVRELSVLFLSERKCTLRELLDALSKITRILSSLESLDDFRKIEDSEDRWSSFYLKFQLMTLLSTLLYQVNRMLHKSNLADEFTPEVRDSQRNQEIVAGLKKECTTKIKLLFFIAMNTILAISHSDLNYKFWLYNREIFSSWIGMQSLFFIDLVVTEETEREKLQQREMKHTTSFVFSAPPILRIKDLEYALFDFNMSKQSKFLNTVEEASHPFRIVSYMTSIYESLMKIPLLISDYTFFVKAKLFLIGIYFLYSYIKYHSEKGFEIHEYFDKLKNLMKKILTRQMQHGSLAPLLPADQILSGNLEKNEPLVKRDPARRAASESRSPSRPKNALTGDQWNNTVLAADTLGSPSQYDRVASSVFEDEGLMSIFSDIDDYFSKDNQ